MEHKGKWKEKEKKNISETAWHLLPWHRLVGELVGLH